MKLALIALFCVLGGGAAIADEAQDCQANAGHYVTGTVQAGPSFVHGHYKQGVELSHSRPVAASNERKPINAKAETVATTPMFRAAFDRARAIQETRTCPRYPKR